MSAWTTKSHFIPGALLGALLLGVTPSPGAAQENGGASSAAASQAASGTQASDRLDEGELEILVARIALYPDELVALISAASLYPLQIVEAARYLDEYAKDSSLKPKDSWDGSVISLLNYPEIVGMMSKDLDWTQSFGQAITDQQKDVLVAIQKLRDQAVSSGVIKTDDKVTVTTKNDNVIITPTSPDKVYVPQYEPQMLYVESYTPVPVAYYPEPYPNYYYPTATFYAGAVTGALWASAVDWNSWGVWGGNWHGNDVDIDVDCNHCLNNVNGKVNFNDIDWKNVDRSKLHFDQNQLSKINSGEIANGLRDSPDNNLGNKATDIRGDQRPDSKATDVRKSTLDGLKSHPGDNRAGQNKAPDRAQDRAGQSRPDATRPSGKTARPDASRPDPRNGARSGQGAQRPSNPDGMRNRGSNMERGHLPTRGGDASGPRRQLEGGGGRLR